MGSRASTIASGASTNTSSTGDRRLAGAGQASEPLAEPLELPDFRTYAVDMPAPAASFAEATRVLGAFVRDVIAQNPSTFRLLGPDETVSNRLTAVFEKPTAPGGPRPCLARITWPPAGG